MLNFYYYMCYTICDCAVFYVYVESLVNMSAKPPRFWGNYYYFVVLYSPELASLLFFFVLYSPELASLLFTGASS